MKRLYIFLIAVLSFSAPALADDLASVQLENTKATLVSETTGIRPGTVFHLAVILEPRQGWHTYWENPGDAGMPPDFAWDIPKGFEMGAVFWPTPERLVEGPLLTYAYPHSAFLAVGVKAPETLEDGATIPIKVKAQWLVCKDICVPESADLQITLPVGSDTLSDAAPLFAEHRNTGPVIAKLDGHFQVKEKNLLLSAPLSIFKSKDIKSAEFFIREQNIMNYAAPQNLIVEKDNLQLTVQRAEDQPGTSISGILSLTASDNSVSSYYIAFDEENATAGETLWFPVVLLFAVLGGLILNLMPCVLPILSLKALAIAKKSGGKHEHVVRQGVAYTLGILVTFTIIAGVLISLRQGGESVGWGYQMQSPAFVGFLIYLLFMVGLSLSGVFHLPVLLGNVGSKISNESSARGSFFTGVLATAVATPCTAPFMASAVGAALTMPPLQALLVFEALGFGLALPFLLISLFPRLRKFLPKPGAWMDTFKQLIAFPMYASVIWLMWVLTLQTGAGGMVVALCGMLLIVIIIWMKSLFADGSKTYTLVALALYAALLIVSLPNLSSMEIATAALPGGHAEHDVETVAYSKEKLEELRKSGKPVFVDATAAWCITCQVNARVAVHTDATMKLFKEKGITLMIADWTRRNDAITEFLSSFGYKGVPLVVYYPSDNKKPIVLPQILTESIVINIIKGE